MQFIKKKSLHFLLIFNSKKKNYFLLKLLIELFFRYRNFQIFLEHFFFIEIFLQQYSIKKFQNIFLNF